MTNLSQRLPKLPSLKDLWNRLAPAKPAGAPSHAGPISIRVVFEPHYAPLWLVILPQAFAVFLWLLVDGLDWLKQHGFAENTALIVAVVFFAMIGALGYESVYVGAIAWAERGSNNRYVYGTAASSLLFSVLVAFHVYEFRGPWSLLHAGFPFVGFWYSIAMHTATRPGAVVADAAPVITLDMVQQLIQDFRNRTESQLQSYLQSFTTANDNKLRLVYDELRGEITQLASGQITPQQIADLLDQRLAALPVAQPATTAEQPLDEMARQLRIYELREQDKDRWSFSALGREFGMTGEAARKIYYKEVDRRKQEGS